MAAHQSVEALTWETRRLFRALAAAADQALAPLGLSAGDRALIEFLAREDGPITLAALARKRSVSRQHIHQSLSRIESRGWIDKRADPGDARSLLLQLTADGRRLWSRIRDVDRAILRRIARAVDERRAREAADTLRAIRAVLEGGHHDDQNH